MSSLSIPADLFLLRVCTPKMLLCASLYTKNAFRPELSKCLLLFLKIINCTVTILKDIWKYVSKIKNLSQILKMSSSNFAFEPFNYQTGCKHPPLLNFSFCPSSGHFRTQFPQIGLFQMRTLEYFRPLFVKHTATLAPICIWTVISQMGWKITSAQ